MENRLIQLEEGLQLVEKGMKEVIRSFQQLPGRLLSSEDLESLYSIIHRMCTQLPPYEYAEQLYEKYKEVLVDYVNEWVFPALRQKNSVDLLKELVEKWNRHKAIVKKLSHSFSYLDHHYAPRNSLPTVSWVGRYCFLDSVRSELRGNVRDAFLALILTEREGVQIDHAVLRDVRFIYEIVDIEFYEKEFQEQFLVETAKYYSQKAKGWIVEDSCPQYMLKVEICLKRERERVRQYLLARTEDKLVEVVVRELLLAYEIQLLEDENYGLRALLRDAKVDDLSRIYRLYSNVSSGLKPIQNMFKQHIIDDGIALIKQSEDAAYSEVFIWKILEVYDKFFPFVLNCFGSHSIFHQAFKEAVEIVLGSRVSDVSNAQLLAIFCDKILKGGDHAKSNVESDDFFEKVVKLICCVDRDEFAEFYRMKLSRRLIFDTGANDDQERSILSKMKQHLGGDFSRKMEAMVIDVRMARKRQADFQEYVRQNSNFNLGYDMTALVFPSGAWPTFPSSTLTIPDDMVSGMELFQQFYRSHKKGSKVTFIHSLGSCNIKAKFGRRTFELVVGTYQAAALLLFDNADHLSFSEVASKLNLANEELLPVLESLSCGEYKILIKKPLTPHVSPTDAFSFNYEFTNRMRTIHIPQPEMHERRAERTVVRNVGIEREYSIDVMVVRIMKSKKLLVYEELITECVEKLSPRFKPDLALVQTRIEDLIKREYMEMDKENTQLIRYLP